MKFILLFLFTGTLVFSQAQNTIKLTGTWCDDVMELSVDLNPDANIMTWSLNGEKLPGEINPTINCQSYGAGKYEVKLAQGDDIILRAYEVSAEEVPEINFSVASYPAAAVTICENITIAGEEIANLKWDFGNNETSTETRGLVFYKAEKEYSIKLSLTTVSGCTYSVYKKHKPSFN